MDVSKKLKESVSGLYTWKEKRNLEPTGFAQPVYPPQPSYTPVDLPSDQEDLEQKNGIICHFLHYNIDMHYSRRGFRS